MSFLGFLLILVFLIYVVRVDDNSRISNIRSPLVIVLIIVLILWLVSGFGFTPWWGWGPRF